MAQPNLAAIGQAYNVLGAEMPLMVNHPAIGQVAELRQAIEQMGAQLAAQMGAQIDARIAQLEDRVVAKIDFVSHLAHARALNSAASNDDSRLHPIPLPDPNANVDILAQFPPTRRHFRVLSVYLQETPQCEPTPSTVTRPPCPPRS
ncbi:hypothetical protein BDV93DRAFT_609203 [Ceratobasidium sp. AG-I]|nr:hypothetical protein BDV93DRAFT_609203 [Ceratobasidium sp. AG-I]